MQSKTVAKRCRQTEEKDSHSMLRATLDEVMESDLLCCAVARAIEQSCFVCTLDLFNGQIANFTLKPLKVTC